MLGLIKSDLYRIYRDKIFWIMTIIVLAFAVLLPIIVFLFILLIKSGVGAQMEYEGYSQEAIAAGMDEVDKMFTPFGISFFVFSSLSVNSFVIPIFVLILLSKDVMQGTIRNKIIVGKTREAVYFSNIIVSIIIVLGLTIASIILSFIASVIFFHTGMTGDAVAEYFGKIGLMLLGWAVIAVVLAALACGMKNVGLAIVTYMVVYYILLMVPAMFLSFYPTFEIYLADWFKSFLVVINNMNLFYDMMGPLAPAGGIPLVGMIEPINGFFYLEFFVSLVITGGIFAVPGFFIFKNKDLK